MAFQQDAITPEEALELLRSKQAGKAERLARVRQEGFPSYTTSVGWFGYSDEKVARLTREAIAQGFNHFKVKVGGDVKDDARRLALVRSIIDDPKECAGRPVPAPETLVGKNAGPTGSVLSELICFLARARERKWADSCPLPSRASDRRQPGLGCQPGH